MKTERVPYEKQVFVCTNDRGGESPSCGDHRGELVFQKLRQMAKDRGLHPRIRVAQAKCLGQCSQGVNIMIYPDAIWYSNVSLEDVGMLADQYLTPREKT